MIRSGIVFGMVILWTATVPSSAEDNVQRQTLERGAQTRKRAPSSMQATSNWKFPPSDSPPRFFLQQLRNTIAAGLVHKDEAAVELATIMLLSENVELIHTAGELVRSLANEQAFQRLLGAFRAADKWASIGGGLDRLAQIKGIAFRQNNGRAFLWVLAYHLQSKGPEVVDVAAGELTSIEPFLSARPALDHPGKHLPTRRIRKEPELAKEIGKRWMTWLDGLDDEAAKEITAAWREEVGPIRLSTLPSVIYMDKEGRLLDAEGHLLFPEQDKERSAE